MGQFVNPEVQKGFFPVSVEFLGKELSAAKREKIVMCACFCEG